MANSANSSNHHQPKTSFGGHVTDQHLINMRESSPNQIQTHSHYMSDVSAASYGAIGSGNQIKLSSKLQQNAALSSQPQKAYSGPRSGKTMSSMHGSKGFQVNFMNTNGSRKQSPNKNSLFMQN